MVKLPGCHETTARSTEEVSVPTLVLPPVHVTLEPPAITVNGAYGTAASKGLGSIDIGPTANIAMNNLRRDNLTGGAFFICEYTEQFVTRLRLTKGADGRRGGTGKKILRRANPLQVPDYSLNGQFRRLIAPSNPQSWVNGPSF